jgi:hypothetical protein
VIQSPDSQVKWKFTGLYGHPEVNKRHETWSLLKKLARLDPLPWLCVGDFNEVLTQTEKWGGRGRLDKQMVDFQQALEYCELFDMGYRGPKYTWSNCQESQFFIKEMLDRGVANNGWYELFPEAEVLVETTSTSDHATFTGEDDEAPKR